MTIVNRFCQILDQELDIAQRMLLLLQCEQQALIECNTDELPVLTEEKTTIVASMSELAATRSSIMNDGGIAAEPAALQAWFEAAGKAAEPAWKKLIAIAAEAKELNRTNGLMISRQMARNQGALNVLHGAVSNGGFYGPDGQSTVNKPGRSFLAG